MLKINDREFEIMLKDEMIARVTDWVMELCVLPEGGFRTFFPEFNSVTQSVEIFVRGFDANDRLYTGAIRVTSTGAITFEREV